MSKIHTNKLSFYNKNVGKNLRYYRKINHKSQLEIAKLLGIDKSTISLYENGKANIPVKYLCAVAGILKAPANVFFEHYNEKFKTSNYSNLF